jgi:hypothetical protein
VQNFPLILVLPVAGATVIILTVLLFSLPSPIGCAGPRATSICILEISGKSYDIRPTILAVSKGGGIFTNSETSKLISGPNIVYNVDSFGKMLKLLGSVRLHKTRALSSTP